MSRFRSDAPGYVRPVRGWWWRKPYFMRYMVREGSAVFLAAYALILLAGLNCLRHGEAAYNAWRAMLATPPALLFHTAAFAAVLYHAITWFQVMPKTAPKLKLAPATITRAGYVAMAVVSVLVWAMMALGGMS